MNEEGTAVGAELENEAPVQEVFEESGDASSIFDVPETDALPPNAKDPDAHRVKVTGVSLKRTDDGGVIMTIGAVSIDTGGDIKHDLWLPAGYAEDPAVDPKTLPVSEEFSKNQQGKYASTVHNSKNTATLDKYLVYAYNQGRSGIKFSAIVQAANIDEVAERLNTTLSGIELIMVRKPQKNNPEFLNVTGTHPIEDTDNPKFLSFLSKGGYRVAWQS